MTSLRRHIVLILGMAVVATLLNGDWADYRPGMLSAVWAEAAIAKGADFTIEPRYVKYALEAIYVGEHRDTDPERRKLIRAWAKAVSAPQFAELYESEIAVKSGDRTYWLALQNPLVNAFAAEAASGAKLKLYVFCIGAVKEDRVIVVNEFQVLGK